MDSHADRFLQTVEANLVIGRAMTFFSLEMNFTAIISYAYPTRHCNHLTKVFVKVGHKDLWPLEMGHGTKKVENHWSRILCCKPDVSPVLYQFSSKLFLLASNVALASAKQLLYDKKLVIQIFRLKKLKFCKYFQKVSQPQSLFQNGIKRAQELN